MCGRLEDRQFHEGRVGLEERNSDVCRCVYDFPSRSLDRFGLELMGISIRIDTTDDATDKALLTTVKTILAARTLQKLFPNLILAFGADKAYLWFGFGHCDLLARRRLVQ